MYSFTRSLIGPKLARMLIQVSVRGQHDQGDRRPSTPSLYWMPKTGIQSSGLGELEARVARQVSRPAAAARRPRSRARCQGERGSAPRARAAGTRRRARPTSGRNVTSERIGRLARSMLSARASEEVRAGHHEQAEGDAQRVVLDAPGLDLAELAPRGRRAAADAVDRAVDDRAVEPPQAFATRPPSARRAGR